MDVVALAKSLSLQLTRCEEKRYLDPGKDLMDLCLTGSLTISPLVLGKDLYKPIQTLHCEQHLPPRKRIEVKLLLLFDDVTYCQQSHAVL